MESSLRKSPARALAAALLLLSALPSDASRFALGYQREYWGKVDLERNPNPGQPQSKLGNRHLVFHIDGIDNWYLEEPGFIFSLIAGMAQTKANEVEARNEAIRKGNLTYRWAYATPPPIPTGRWFRWGYSSARKVGAENDSTAVFLYRRYDMNLVTAPRLIGKTDFYWMIGARMSGTSLRIYPKGQRPGDDWSFADTPLDLYLGWQPSAFPWLMLDVFAGYDLIDLVTTAFVGYDNYSSGYSAGGKATLGVDWFTVYCSFMHKQDPLWGYDSYNRRYKGNWTVFGARLDIGNLFFRLMGGLSGGKS